MEIVGNLLLSLVGGGIAGAVVTYLLQIRGKIIIRASRWETYDSQEQPEIYRFHITAYNTALIPDGLSDCRVVFSKGDKELFTSRPARENREGRHEMILGGGQIPYRPPLEVIELPPRTPAHVEARGTLKENEADKARQCDRVEFVGHSPSKGEIREEVAISTSTPFPVHKSP